MPLILLDVRHFMVVPHQVTAANPEKVLSASTVTLDIQS